jgi:hypothetical protein
MSRRYKSLNKERLYFVSFATANWIDLFVRDEYCSIIVDSLDYYRKEKVVGKLLLGYYTKRKKSRKNSWADKRVYIQEVDESNSGKPTGKQKGMDAVEVYTCSFKKQ